MFAQRCSHQPDIPAASWSLSRTSLALARATLRELAYGLSTVSGEVRRWHARAQAIPEPALRDDALRAIERKRGNIDGAALFATIADSRSRSLLKLLVAYEILADYLDCTSERAADRGVQNGLRLHRALTDAIDPYRPVSDYYHLHPWREDGGYISHLVQACRRGCLTLPAYEAVRQPLVDAAELTQVLALNHEPRPPLRDALLKDWSAAHFPDRSELTWFEWTGAASAWLTVLALLAAAADSHLTRAEASAIYHAYMPWISLAGTLLDSYGDEAEDARNNDHSYIAHYQSKSLATDRIREVVRRAGTAAATLPNAPRHTVIVACMVAMYLTKDSVQTAENRGRTLDFLRAGGPATRSLAPVLRAWRTLYGQQTA